jgi:predicted small secreted protein
MRKNTWAIIALLVVLALILAACGAPAGGGKSAAATAVENYYKAVVGKDAAKVSAIACKDWESQALMDMDGFQAVKTELEGLSCKDSGTDGSTTLVSCTGKINVTYNTEQQVIDLSRQIYRVVQEGGDYRVCGYK